jgi:membrane associated rhomboid family serine protease
MAFATAYKKNYMFFPIGDDNRDRGTTPYINYFFIAINIFIFIYFQGMGHDWRFTYAYATVPAEILTGQDIISNSKVLTDVITGEQIQVPGLQRTPINVYGTLLTSMFMHGGWAHLLGNMLFLLIFGDNVEDAMGHRRYLYFYLLCGILAALCHVFFTANSAQSVYTPSLGASGAISGIMGAYILLFPSRSVHLWIFFLIISVPAFIAVGLWFVFQVINGLGKLGGDDASGVAYAAHIGGFIAGLLLVKAFAKPRRVQLIKEEEARW